MLYRYDPQMFVDQSLHLEDRGQNDYRVTIAGHTAGRIFRTMKSASQHVWLWTVTGPYLPGAGLNSSGDNEDIRQAKADFRATFDAWLGWAIQQDAPIIWHE